MFLTKNSKSNYKVIWKSGNLAAEYASQELQKYVRLISGVDLEIVESSAVFNGNFFHIGLIKDANQQAQLEKLFVNAFCGVFCW